MAAVVKHLPHYKIADYQRWEGDWELIKGIPFATSPSANKIHQDTARNTLKMLMASACSCKIYYELDLILSDDTVVRPDLMILCDLFEGDYPTVAPDLAVEIISVSSRNQDRVVKFELYQEYGVKYYLLVDPEYKQVNVFALDRQKYVDMELTEPIQLKDCEIRLNFERIFG